MMKPNSASVSRVNQNRPANHDRQRILVLDRFRAAAANFIQTVDSVAAMERDAFLPRLNHCLAELYSSALDLPVVQPDVTSIDETPFAAEKWAELCNSLRDKIGPFDAYWGIFDSTENESPVQGTLAGDISEIYFDLNHILHLEEKGASQSDFLWKLRSSFRSHWGKHLLGALVAIHDRHIWLVELPDI
jgi:hypothetical protein